MLSLHRRRWMLWPYGLVAGREWDGQTDKGLLALSAWARDPISAKVLEPVAVEPAGIEIDLSYAMGYRKHILLKTTAETHPLLEAGFAPPTVPSQSSLQTLQALPATKIGVSQFVQGSLSSLSFLPIFHTPLANPTLSPLDPPPTLVCPLL